MEQYSPFCSERIGEPPLGHKAARMLEVLPEAIAARYADDRNMFRRPPEQEANYAELRVGYHSVLGPRSEFVRYLSREEVWELWELAPAEEARATLSIDAVLKKNLVDLLNQLAGDGGRQRSSRTTDQRERPDTIMRRSSGMGPGSG